MEWVDITGRDEELEERGIDPKAALQELHVELSSHLSQVVGVASTMLLQQGSPGFLLGGQVQNEHLCVATLKCVAAWVPAYPFHTTLPWKPFLPLRPPGSLALLASRFGHRALCAGDSGGGEFLR